MEIKIIDSGSILMAEIISDEMVISQTQDALEIIGNCSYQGAYCVLMHEKHFHPSFFDLKSGLAGDILQKFSTYNLRLAIVGDFQKYESKSLQDFIRESNRMRQIGFVSSFEEGVQFLTN